MRVVGLALLLTPSAAFAARVVKGPWILDVEGDRATIVFELDAEAPANVVLVDRGGQERTVASRAQTLHRVKLTGLEPARRYRFRVEVEGSRVPEGTFMAAPLLHWPAKYLVYGDTRTNHDDHASVVRAMLRERPDVVVHTGDYVADGADDDGWVTYFDVAKRLLRRAMILPTMGNHESYRPGGKEAYQRHLALAGAREGATEDAVARWGDTVFLLMSSNNAGFPAAQRRWFEGRMEAFANDRTVRWRVAVLHHGPFSSGHHGGNEEMKRDGLVEFLRGAGVDVVFCGHDHDYERGVADLPFVVTGGGGAPLYPTNRQESYQERFEATLHYLRVESEEAGLRVTAVRPDGTSIESCVLEGGAWECRGGRRPVRPAEGASVGWIEIAAAGGGLLAVAMMFGARLVRRLRG